MGGRQRVTPDADVLVVGYGPVGATLAGLLARRGVRVLAVDRATELFPLPRAAHCDHEILRILQELGCADEVVEAMVVNTGMDFLDAEHEVLLSLTAPSEAPSGWPSSVLFHQPGFEAAVRRAVGRTGAEVRLGSGVEDVDVRDDGVAARLEGGSTIAARFAVGCDGARSMMRDVVGGGLDDLHFEEPWLVVDLLLRSTGERLPAHAWQVCDPRRPTTLVPMPAPRFRFEFMQLEGETAEEMLRPERIHSLLAEWIDPAGADVERAAVYTFHGLVGRRWRRGRLFLAGDAAHQMPPFLGQGMCSGMRDAANLAWKLAAVLNDGAGDSLLDTYQEEREPHVRSIIDTAVGFGRIICTTDPDVAATRNRDLRAGSRHQEQPEASPPLCASSALAGGGGQMSPQPWLGGRRLDDVLGPRFAVVTAQPVPDSPSRRWWERRACLLDTAASPELGVLLGEAEAVVVRPDRYVFGYGSLEELTEAARAVLQPEEVAGG